MALLSERILTRKCLLYLRAVKPMVKRFVSELYPDAAPRATSSRTLQSTFGSALNAAWQRSGTSLSAQGDVTHILPK